MLFAISSRLIVLQSILDSLSLLPALVFSRIGANQEWSLLLDEEDGLIRDEVFLLRAESLEEVPLLTVLPVAS